MSPRNKSTKHVKFEYRKLRQLLSFTNEYGKSRITLLQPQLHISHLKQSKHSQASGLLYPDWYGHEEFIPQYRQDLACKAIRGDALPAGRPTILDPPGGKKVTDEMTQTDDAGPQDIPTVTRIPIPTTPIGESQQKQSTSNHLGFSFVRSTKLGRDLSRNVTKPRRMSVQRQSSIKNSKVNPQFNDKDQRMFTGNYEFSKGSSSLDSRPTHAGIRRPRSFGSTNGSIIAGYQTSSQKLILEKTIEQSVINQSSINQSSINQSSIVPSSTDRSLHNHSLINQSSINDSPISDNSRLLGQSLGSRVEEDAEAPHVSILEPPADGVFATVERFLVSDIIGCLNFDSIGSISMDESISIVMSNLEVGA